jgi:hypothetical protein
MGYHSDKMVAGDRCVMIRMSYAGRHAKVAGLALAISDCIPLIILKSSPFLATRKKEELTSLAAFCSVYKPTVFHSIQRI